MSEYVAPADAFEIFDIKLTKEKSMFLHDRMYNHLKTTKYNTGKMNALGYKTRICDTKGVYQAQKIYELTIYEKDKKRLVKEINSYLMQCEHPSTLKSTFISIHDFMGTYFPDEVVVCRDSDSMQSCMFARNISEGFPGQDEGYYNRDVYKIRFAFLKDFIKIPLCNKELQMIQAKNDKVANIRMADLTVKDNILNALKEKGFVCSIADYCDRDGTSVPSVYIDDRENFNKLINVAIEHYINDAVKDLHCIIHLTKQKKNHTRRPYEPLFRLADIELPTIAIQNK